MIQIPKSWKDIKLPQFELLIAVEQHQYDDELDRTIDWIAALTKSTPDEIASLPFDKLSGIIKQLAWAREGKFNTRIPKFFTCGGQLFEVVYQVEKFTSVQYRELEEWLADDPINNLDKIMATLTIERKWWLKGGRYDPATHAKRAAIFKKELSLAVIYPLALFFQKVFVNTVESVNRTAINKINRVNKDLLKELQKLLKEQEVNS